MEKSRPPNCRVEVEASQPVVLARPVLPALALGWRAGEVRAAKLPRASSQLQEPALLTDDMICDL